MSTDNAQLICKITPLGTQKFSVLEARGKFYERELTLVGTGNYVMHKLLRRVLKLVTIAFDLAPNVRQNIPRTFGMPRAGVKPELKERRKHPRLRISIPVFIRGIGEDGREFLEFATAVNISASGTLVLTRRSLPISASLSLEIPVAPLPPADFTLQSTRSLKAKLVRVSHGERCHMVAFKFLRQIQE